MLSGESGAGKTEMLRAAGNVAAEFGVPVIRVSRPPGGRVDLTQLVAALLSQSDPDLPAADTIQTVLRPPHKAVLIDDLDLLPDDCLQLIAQLLRPSAEPGGVAIVGTATLDPGAGPSRPELAELSRNARASARLPRIGPAEARQYIERSLWIAGGTTRRLITSDALKLVVARSHGLPDAINRQMEAAFTAGFARGDPVITVKTLAATTGPARQRPEAPEFRTAGPGFMVDPCVGDGPVGDRDRGVSLQGPAPSRGAGTPDSHRGAAAIAAAAAQARPVAGCASVARDRGSPTGSPAAAPEAGGDIGA